MPGRQAGIMRIGLDALYKIPHMLPLGAVPVDTLARREIGFAGSRLG